MTAVKSKLFWFEHPAPRPARARKLLFTSQWFINRQIARSRTAERFNVAVNGLGGGLGGSNGFATTSQGVKRW